MSSLQRHRLVKEFQKLKVSLQKISIFNMKIHNGKPLTKWLKKTQNNQAKSFYSRLETGSFIC